MFRNQQLGGDCPLRRMLPKMFGQTAAVLVGLAASLALEVAIAALLLARRQGRAVACAAYFHPVRLFRHGSQRWPVDDSAASNRAASGHEPSLRKTARWRRVAPRVQGSKSSAGLYALAMYGSCSIIIVTRDGAYGSVDRGRTERTALPSSDSVDRIGCAE